MKVKSNNIGVCPFCNEVGNLDYECFEMADNEMGYYKWFCPNCKHEGEEWYILEFIGHNVIDEEGNNVEIEKDMIEDC